MSNSLSRNASWQSLGRYPRLGRAEVPGLGAQYYQEPQPPQPRAQGASSRPYSGSGARAWPQSRSHGAISCGGHRPWYQSSGEVFAVRTYLLASMGTLPPLTSTQRGYQSRRRCSSTQGHRVVLEVVRTTVSCPSSHPTTWTPAPSRRRRASNSYQRLLPVPLEPQRTHTSGPSGPKERSASGRHLAKGCQSLAVRYPSQGVLRRHLVERHACLHRVHGFI